MVTTKEFLSDLVLPDAVRSHIQLQEDLLNQQSASLLQLDNDLRREKEITTAIQTDCRLWEKRVASQNEIILAQSKALGVANARVAGLDAALKTSHANYNYVKASQEEWKSKYLLLLEKEKSKSICAECSEEGSPCEPDSVEGTPCVPDYESWTKVELLKHLAFIIGLIKKKFS